MTEKTKRTKVEMARDNAEKRIARMNELIQELEGILGQEHAALGPMGTALEERANALRRDVASFEAETERLKAMAAQFLPARSARKPRGPQPIEEGKKESA